MEPHEIRELFDYHYWAHGHIVSHLAALSPEHITAPSNRFYDGSAFLALRHLLDVDWSWMQWCMGLPGLEYVWEIEDLSDFASLRVFLSREEKRIKAYIGSLNAEDLAREIDIGTAQKREPRWFKQWQILLHILNHGTEHRTQLAHFLTDLGHSPGEIDFMHYLSHIKQAGA